MDLVTTKNEIWRTQEKAQCVVWLAETKSVKVMPRDYRPQYGKELLSKQTIREWLEKFLEIGSVQLRPECGRPSVSDERVEQVCESFQRNPRKSLQHASRELNLPCTVTFHSRRASSVCLQIAVGAGWHILKF